MIVFVLLGSLLAVVVLSRLWLVWWKASRVPPLLPVPAATEPAPESNVEAAEVQPLSRDYAAVYRGLQEREGRPEMFFAGMAEQLGGYWIASTIAGASYANRDGTSRQSAIRQLDLMEELDLQHETGNAFDPYACRVCDRKGRQLGYLERRLAAEVFQALQKGTQIMCFVLDVTGHVEDDMVGCNIAILAWNTEETSSARVGLRA